MTRLTIETYLVAEMLTFRRGYMVGHVISISTNPNLCPVSTAISIVSSRVLGRLMRDIIGSVITIACGSPGTGGVAPTRLINAAAI
jgi:hypothetical protein